MIPTQFYIAIVDGTEAPSYYDAKADAPKTFAAFVKKHKTAESARAALSGTACKPPKDGLIFMFAPEGKAPFVAVAKPTKADDGVKPVAYRRWSLATFSGRKFRTLGDYDPALAPAEAPRAESEVDEPVGDGRKD